MCQFVSAEKVEIHHPMTEKRSPNATFLNTFNKTFATMPGKGVIQFISQSRVIQTRPDCAMVCTFISHHHHHLPFVYKY